MRVVGCTVRGKINCYEIQDPHTETFKTGTEISTVGPLVDGNVFCNFSEQERLDIFKRYWSLGDINGGGGGNHIVFNGVKK